MAEGKKPYKDSGLNHRKTEAYSENMQDLVNKIKVCGLGSEKMKQVLVPVEYIKEGTHSPDHSLCTHDGRAPSDADGREKRICRCMYYYNREDAAPGQKEKCAACKFAYKRRNKSRYTILDYEVPTPRVIERTGGIDLLLQDQETGIVYATEFKPESSRETLVRMVAEILTYCELWDYEVNGNKVEPAICFFEGKCQYKDYFERFEKHELFDYVSVFSISVTETSFDITRIR